MSPKYPELETIARFVADQTTRSIMQQTASAVSAMPYRAQFVLERVIQILEKRV